MRHSPALGGFSDGSESASSSWGGADILLAWYPTAFGTVEWEFGAISATLNGLALPTLGAFMALCAAFAGNRRLAVRIIGAAMLVMAFLLVVAAVIYATDVPVALRAVDRNPALVAGVAKSIIKASLLLVVYFTLFLSGGLNALRSGNRSSR